jgi:molecular chaperone DnaK (HSP70)
MGKTIGIKLADGTFYPVLSTGAVGTKELGLTTVQENQSEVHIDLYRGDELDGAQDLEIVEYLDSLHLDQLIPQPAGDVDIDLTLTIDENDLFVADLFDPESGERSVKTIPHVTLRSTGITAAPELAYDMFGTVERGQDLLDSVEDIDEESSEEGGDEATEEIGLPFDDDDEVTGSVESLFVDEESARTEPVAPIEPAPMNSRSAAQLDSLLKDMRLDEKADFYFGDGSLPPETTRDYEAEPAPPERDALMKRMWFIGIGIVIIFIEVLIVCFITIRPRLVSATGSRAYGNSIVSDTFITPAPRS